MANMEEAKKQTRMRSRSAWRHWRIMKTEERILRTCPICGREYSEHPALSRVDGLTPICPDCGTREALESIGVSKEQQDKILGIIHGVGRSEDV